MTVPVQRRSFGTVPSLRQIILGAARMLTNEISERDHSIPYSFSDIKDLGCVGVLLECELLLSLGMNGMRQTGGSLGEV